MFQGSRIFTHIDVSNVCYHNSKCAVDDDNDVIIDNDDRTRIEERERMIKIAYSI